MLQVTFTDESADLVEALLIDRMTEAKRYPGVRFWELELSECLNAIGHIHHAKEMKRLNDIVNSRQVRE